MSSYFAAIMSSSGSIGCSVPILILQAFKAAIRESAAAPTSKMNPVAFPTLSGDLTNDDVAEEEDPEVGGPRDGVRGVHKPERDLERLARVTQLTNQIPDKEPLIGEAQVEQGPSEHRGSGASRETSGVRTGQ